MFHGHCHLEIIFIHQVKHHLLIHIKIVIKNKTEIHSKNCGYLDFISATDLDTIARRYDFEPLYSTNETQTKSINSDPNLQWMNAGVLFTDKTIEPDVSGIHKTGFDFLI